MRAARRLLGLRQPAPVNLLPFPIWSQPMLTPTSPLVMRFVVAAAVTLPAAVCAADAPHADATAKDACLEACNECLRCRALRRCGLWRDHRSERTLIRWGSSTRTAPRSILGAISARLASNSLTWPIGFRGVAPRNSFTDGRAVFRMARMVPKSVSAETITR